MPSKVLPVKRTGETLRLAGCAGFALLGLTLMMFAIFTAEGGVLMFVLGALCAALFGRVAIQGLRTLGSPGLLLSADGFEHNGDYCAWADIETFSVKRERHVKVEFIAGVDLSLAARTSVALGKLGFYTAPAYIPVVSFETDGLPLAAILQNWLWSSRLGRWDDDDERPGPTT